MRRNRRRPFLTPVFAVSRALLLSAGLLLLINGLSRQEKYTYLASLTPTPSAVPRKVSYIYDSQTPAPTALLIGSGKEGPLVSLIQQRLKENVDHGGDHLAERGTDDNTDGHVDHVSSEGKLLELLEQLFNHAFLLPFAN